MSTPRQELATYAAVAAYPPFLADGLGQCASDPYPDDFTEDGTHALQRRARARAVRVCYGCPFIHPCLDWAIATGQQGVYGGTTTQERGKWK